MVIKSFPTQEQFLDFVSLSFPEPTTNVSSDTQLAIYPIFTDSKLIASLKQHIVFNFLVNHISFQNALKCFERTPWCKHCKIIGKIFYEERALHLTCIMSNTIVFYLNERAYERKTRKVFLTTKKKRNRSISDCIKIEKIIANFRKDYVFINTKKISAEVQKIKNFIASDTPAMFSKRHSGDPIAKMLVYRVCQLYYVIFREISPIVIRHLVNIVFDNENLKISEELFKSWVNNIRKEIITAESSGASIL